MGIMRYLCEEMGLKEWREQRNEQKELDNCWLLLEGETVFAWWPTELSDGTWIFMEEYVRSWYFAWNNEYPHLNKCYVRRKSMGYELQYEQAPKLIWYAVRSLGLENDERYTQYKPQKKIVEPVLQWRTREECEKPGGLGFNVGDYDGTEIVMSEVLEKMQSNTLKQEATAKHIAETVQKIRRKLSHLEGVHKNK